MEKCTFIPGSAQLARTQLAQALRVTLTSFDWITRDSTPATYSKKVEQVHRALDAFRMIGFGENTNLVNQIPTSIMPSEWKWKYGLPREDPMDITTTHDKRFYHAMVGSSGVSVKLDQTLRIPDDGNTYPFPRSLGDLPLVNAEDMTRAPNEWRTQKAFIAPVSQADAFRFKFDIVPNLFAPPPPLAMIIGAGGVNVVSGQQLTPILRPPSDGQNYIVVHQNLQTRLDGYNAGVNANLEPVVRQFVAAKVGSRQTVGEQLGQGIPLGGVQVFVRRMTADGIASFYAKELSALVEDLLNDKLELEDQHQFQTRQARPRFPIHMGLSHMGLAQGGLTAQKLIEDPYGPDFWESHFESIIIYLVTPDTYKMLTGYQYTGATPSIYTHHHLPWFDIYAEPPPLEGTGTVNSADTPLTAASSTAHFSSLEPREQIKIPPIQVVKLDLPEFPESSLAFPPLGTTNTKPS